MFKKYLWLSDTKLRKKAIFHCYRYAIKSLKSIEMNELRINLKKLIRDEMVYFKYIIFRILTFDAGRLKI